MNQKENAYREWIKSEISTFFDAEMSRLDELFKRLQQQAIMDDADVLSKGIPKFSRLSDMHNELIRKIHEIKDSLDQNPLL